MEQQKISACLSSADEMISLQSEKINTLKAHKTALMQQLFPRPSPIYGRGEQNQHLASSPSCVKGE